MSGLLIDTHVLIWMLYSPERLSEQTKTVMSNSGEVFVSMASLWEIAIKHSLGKLKYDPKIIIDKLEASGLELLDIKSEHVKNYKRVKLPQGDPFDIMIMSQALAGEFSVVTADRLILEAYPKKTFDART